MKSFNIKTLFQKIRLPKRREFRTIGEKARHDWKIVLLSFFLLSAALVGTHSLLFVRIEKGEILTGQPSGTTSAETISKETLESTVRFFDDRAEKLEALRTERPQVVDPSI